MKEAVTKVIDTLTQEDFYRAFQKFLERYNKYIAAGGDYFEWGLEFHVCIINKSAHTKKVWKLIVCLSYMYVCIVYFISRLLFEQALLKTTVYFIVMILKYRH